MTTDRLEVHQNEEKRIQELLKYDILDTSEEKDFDDIVELASQISGTPIALISLVDQSRQWFKARKGVGLRETPRNISFCTHAIKYENGMVINDALKDERFSSNPFVVNDPNFRFYAGVPLKSELGYNLGTLCVIDQHPKEFTEEQLVSLKMLANQVMKLLDLRLTIKTIKEATELAAKNELRFRTLADSAPLGIYQTNVEGRGVYVNRRWCEIANVSEADALGTGWIRSIHDEDRHSVLCAWTYAIDNRNDFNFEFRFQNSSKEVRWVKSHASPMRDESGTLVGYVGTIEDITLRKKAERQLKESEMKYRLISTNSKDVIALLSVDPKPVHTFLSPSVKEVLGYEPEELLGKSPYDIIYKDDQPLIKSEVHPASAGISQVRQLRIVKKDSSVIWVEIVSGLAFDDDGKEIGTIASIRDIHEQKLAEFRLEESERLYRLISSHSKDMLTIFEANDEAKCIYVSPSCQEILGYLPEDLVGLSPFQMMPSDQAEELKMNYLTKILNGESVRTENQLRKSDGALIWVEALSQPIYNEMGQVLTFQSSVREISERKKFEQQLKEEKEKAEASTLAKSQFLSIMSHEIRTPMNAIIGLTNLMLEEQPREDQLEKVNLLKFSGEGLLCLINDILDYSKIEAGKVELENIAFNLPDILQKYIDLSSSRADDKGLQLTLKLPRYLPQVVMGDPTRLGQVLNNLIGNAIKFTAYGSVTVEITEKESNQDLSVIHFSIKDTGIGIKPEKLSSIFENFTQASSDTTRKYGGTGLGLSIAKKLLQLMGSTIAVQSEYGKGSEFTFSIPFKIGKEIQQECRVQQKNVKVEGNLHVLLVEDNMINQVVAVNFLKKWGMTVSIANHGREALEKIMDKSYDIILMDLQMPEMDGYEATRTIRAYPDLYFKTVPIFALSASAMLEERDKAMEYGFDDFITKPFQPLELKEKIIQAVNSKNIPVV